MKVHVHFRQCLDEDLKAAILDHLPSVIRRKMKKGVKHSVGNSLVRYAAKISGDKTGALVNISNAGWTKDMLYVDVK